LEKVLKDLKNKLSDQMSQVTSIISFLEDKCGDIQFHVCDKEETKQDHDNEVQQCVEELLREYYGFQTEIQTAVRQLEIGPFLQLDLDTEQVEILMKDTYTTALNCSLGFGCYITAAFGANLDQTKTFPFMHGIFVGVIVTTTLLMIFFVLMTFLYIWYVCDYRQRYPAKTNFSFISSKVE